MKMDNTEPGINHKLHGNATNSCTSEFSMHFKSNKTAWRRWLLSNAACDHIFGSIGEGVVCVDTAGGQGSCNVSIVTIEINKTI